MLVNDCGGIVLHDLAGNSGGFDSAPRVTEKAVDVCDAHARNHPLKADASVFTSKEGEQVVLKVVRGGEVSMASLACPWRVARSVPEEARFAQSCSGSDDTLVAGMGTGTGL